MNALSWIILGLSILIVGVSVFQYFLNPKSKFVVQKNEQAAFDKIHAKFKDMLNK